HRLRRGRACRDNAHHPSGGSHDHRGGGQRGDDDGCRHRCHVRGGRRHNHGGWFSRPGERGMTQGASALVEDCGERPEAGPPGPFVIGREADLDVDDNPYLHRAFLELTWDRLWWLANVGTKLTATVADGDGSVDAWLGPGGALPLVFARTEVRF